MNVSVEKLMRYQKGFKEARKVCEKALSECKPSERDGWKKALSDCVRGIKEMNLKINRRKSNG
jgi:hypothetical protein